MGVNRKHTDSYLGDTPDDDLPDMSSDYWVERIPTAKVTRGRPKALTPKISTTLRLDQDVIDAFKADGPGWQTRINAALRKAAGLNS